MGTSVLFFFFRKKVQNCSKKIGKRYKSKYKGYDLSIPAKEFQNKTNMAFLFVHALICKEINHPMGEKNKAAKNL